MKKKRFETQEEFHRQIERRWLETARPPSRTSGAINTIIFVIVLAALLVAAYLNRARIGALWQQVTGKAPPLWHMPEKPKHGEIWGDGSYVCGTARTSPLPSTQAVSRRREP
jgi:hypothetical protein